MVVWCRLSASAGSGRRRWRAAAVAAVALAAPVATAPAATLPADFADELVVSVGAPTALAFVPDGRMLVATQAGVLRVRSAAGALLATPALSLGSRVCTNSERGLLGVAVDPGFATNRFVYVYYTFNKFGNGCPTMSSMAPVNRVSRFVLADTNVIDPATEVVLIDNIHSPAGNHNAGDLQFGKDGHLYVSVGDGGCDYAGDSGCAGANDAARDRHVLLGKVLRITSSGGSPAGNPFVGAGTARCNVTGSTTVGVRCQETFAWGLRNPFRIAVDPTAVGTRVLINDVGQNAWEEIDEAIAGADYGWNVREGHCANGSTTNCGPPPTGMTNPIFDYGRGDGCGSITGGAFVPAANWPATYTGSYLFGDYVCGRIFQLVPNGAGGFTRVTFADGLGASSAVHLAFGPHATGSALYYTTYAGGGAVRRIVFVAGNRAPVADVSAAPTAGAPPLTVSFNASASSDPDPGDSLTYVWDFGDGTATTETTSATTTHAYTTAGTYTATLRVRDNHGATSAPDSVRIDVGNTPPVPIVDPPPEAPLAPLLPGTPAAAHAPAQPACAQRYPRRRVGARPLHGASARATVIARTARRVGSRARTTYRVILVRRCVVVASGSVRDRRLVLHVRRSGARTVARDGRLSSVASYPRLRGRYVLRAGADGPRIAVTTVTFMP